MTQAGLPAVGVPGVQNWKRHFRRCFEDFERVCVLCDGDKPGREFGYKLSHELPNAHMVTCPDGEDPNSVYVKWGKEALWELIGQHE